MIFYCQYFRKYLTYKYVIYNIRKYYYSASTSFYCVKIYVEMLGKSQVKQ